MIDMNKLYLCVLALFFIVQIHAQDIEVKKFEPLEKDQTAVTSPRKDINGTACGLVKVALKEPGAEFEGNVMGDVQFTGSEYLVYMPNGSKRLGIKHPNYLPTTIVFADYGTKKVASSTTYELKVKANKKKAKVDNSKKGMALFNIKPSNAMLLIDGHIADGAGGTYTMPLPYGTHYYTVKLKDFAINNQMFTVSNEVKTFNVDLTFFFSWVNITSTTDNVDIYVNNELKSTDSWEGILPPSTYSIEIRKEGFYPQSKTIELYENDSLAINFPVLKIIGGKIIANFEPDNCNVYIDGKLVGKTPLEFDGVSEGSHKVEISCDNYETAVYNIRMLANQQQHIEGKLQLTDMGYLLTRANEGDLECQWRLGKIYMDRDYGSFERKDLKVNSHRPCPHLERDIDKAIFWLEKAAAGTYDSTKSFYDYPRWAKESLSECNILKKDFQKSFYWAVKSNDAFLLSLHYYYGLGVQKDKQKSAQLLLRIRFKWDENGLKKCAEGNIDDMTLRECLIKYVEFHGKKEIWNTIKELE